jgi:hypothetical protein
VEWEDSATQHGWTIGEQKVTYGKIRSVGMVVESSDKQLTLTLAMNDEGSVMCPLAIPWSSITKVEVL